MVQYGAPGPAPSPAPGYPARSRPKGRGLWAVLLSLLTLLGIGVVLHSTLFRLKSVQVVGISHRTTQEVMTLAGIAMGDNLLTLDKEKIRQGINSDRYLVFGSMQRDYPDGLIIEVYERVPRSNVQTMGVQYTLDGDGMVLEQTQTLQLEDGMVAVTGMQINSCSLGQMIILKNPDQLAAYREVLTQLAGQKVISQISELNLADMDNLYLISVDGFTIRLGDDKDIRAKVGSMRAVLDYLRKAARQKGSVDVSAPVNPTYIPDD